MLLTRVLSASLVVAAQFAGAPFAHAADQERLGAAAFVAVTPACDSPGTPTTTVYLPNITKTLGGAAGWDTPVYIQNAGAIQTTIEVSFYRFGDGSLVACRKTAGVAPGTSLLDDPNADADLPNDTQFSAVVKSFGAPVVATVNQLQGTGATTEALSYAGFSAGATKVYLPNVTRRFFGYDVPFVVQNLGTAATMVNVAFVSFDGAKTFQTSLTVAPGRSGVVDPDFTEGLIDGTQYAVTLTATQPVAVVVNAHNEVIGPVAFSHNGLSSGGTTLYAPFAAKVANGMFSPVVVQNVGTTAADATLTFSPLVAGGLPQSLTLTAIPAGTARAFDPRFALGTSTPCAVAGPTCLGPGEFSLKIQSTGPVAAVVLPNSPGTAAGYVAASSLQTRSLLPIVMRTVGGGPSGWTSLIYLQAGTATQATARYYALSTGSLVTSQSIALTGGSAKIDPRTVPGLQDNGQYAVTIDGNGGTFTAIAHEQAAGGGDGSMIYEGFGVPSLPAGLQPGSLKIQPDNATVAGNMTQQFTAAVNDQFGSPYAGAALIWTVLPPTLGTISSAGLFTAGQIGGSGIVTATAQGVSATATITVQAPATMTVGGISFRVTTTAAADLYTEATISTADVQRLANQVASDMAQVQLDYGKPDVQRPVFYVLPNSASFFGAIATIGGISTLQPSWESGLCVCGSTHNWMFIDWQRESTNVQLTSIRHELTHLIEHALAPQDLLPAWFNEGNARLEEFTVAGTMWHAMNERARAASMAAQGALFTLADLTSYELWIGRPAYQAPYQYAVASQAVQLLRKDIGLTGELAMFRAMAQGQTFEGAYASVAGQPFSVFSGTYATRIRALASAYPGVATSADSPAGAGIAFAFYGLPPNAPFTLSISGDNGYGLDGPIGRTADAYGVYFSSITTARGWPAGTYTISATWAGGTVSTSVTKTTSLSAAFGLGLDSGFADGDATREDPGLDQGEPATH